MSAKLVVTLLATSLLTVGCVAYTDDPYYRGGYGYHDHDDDRYDGRRYSDWERYEQQRKDAREQDRNRREWEKRHREWEKKRLEDRDHNHRDYHDDD